MSMKFCSCRSKEGLLSGVVVPRHCGVNWCNTYYHSHIAPLSHRQKESKSKIQRYSFSYIDTYRLYKIQLRYWTHIKYE